MEYNTVEAIRIKSSWKNILEIVRSSIRKSEWEREREEEREKEKSLHHLGSDLKVNNADGNGHVKAEEMAMEIEMDKEMDKELENVEKKGNREIERDRGSERGSEGGGEGGGEEGGTTDQTHSIHRQHPDFYPMANDGLHMLNSQTDTTADTARNALLRTYGVILSDACTGQTLYTPDTVVAES